MIQVVIGTSHIRAILGYRRGYEFDRALHHALSPLIGWPIREVRELGELDGITVYDLMQEFHDLLRRRLTGHPLLTAQAAEIQRVAREEYFIPDFEVDTDNSVNFFALHGVFAHGHFAQFVLKGRPGEPAERASERIQGYLPDFSHGARFVGCLSTPAGRIKDDEDYRRTKELLDYVRSLEASSNGGLPEELIRRARELLQARAAPLATYGTREPVAALAGTLAATSAGAAFLVQRLRHALERTLEGMESGFCNNVDQAAFQLRRGLAEGEHVDIECHLCDSVRAVYERAMQFLQPEWECARLARERLSRTELLATTNTTHFHDLFLSAMKRIPDPGGDQTLVIDAWVRGFVGYRSLRRDNADVPTLGRHRLLSTAAIRQGMAKPLISAVFPIQLWRQFEKPVEHFLLDAARRVAADQCPPVYPDVPSPDEASELFWAAARAEGGDCGFDIDRHAAPLRRLGLETAFRRRQGQNQNLEQLETGEWARDWTETIFECESALYNADIEQSVHLQDALDLYPLHKRVLGLLEYVVKRRLKDKLLLLNPPPPDKEMNGVSALWAVAFTGWEQKVGGSFVHHPSLVSGIGPTADVNASIEVEGHWLIEAQEQSKGGATSLDLACLLDRFVTQIGQAPEVHQRIGGLDGKPMTLTLKPRSPSEHAGQLAALRNKGNAAAACMTLYLGKIIFSLRNYIEHGHDSVQGACLEIDGSHYWQQARGGKTTYKWVLERATRLDPEWRDKNDLPTTTDQPTAADILLLSPESLHRCLVLVSLVLEAGQNHLGL